MNSKNDIEVLIHNKKYILCGYESSEYLQKVASYINNKYVEIKQMDQYDRLETDMKNILLEINIADDFFKLQDKVHELEEENEQKGKEIFEIKHELIAVQTQLEALQEEWKKLTNGYQEAQKQIVILETEQKERSGREAESGNHYESISNENWEE